MQHSHIMCKTLKQFTTLSDNPQHLQTTCRTLRQLTPILQSKLKGLIGQKSKCHLHLFWFFFQLQNNPHRFSFVNLIISNIFFLLSRFGFRQQAPASHGPQPVRGPLGQLTNRVGDVARTDGRVTTQAYQNNKTNNNNINGNNTNNTGGVIEIQKPHQRIFKNILISCRKTKAKKLRRPIPDHNSSADPD